jgi:hypothetical protein
MLGSRFSPFSAKRFGVFLENQCYDQGCQMVCFQTKNTNLGKFWRVFQWKILVYFMAIWYILWPFGHLVISPHVLVICTKKNLATLVMIQVWFELSVFSVKNAIFSAKIF